MTSRFEAVVVDCNDTGRVGTFWAGLLGRPLGGPDDDRARLIEAGDGCPELILVAVPEGKQSKNRLHIDLRPDDQAGEVERALSLGATRADVGQREVTWIVLADPEGNEFCILRARAPGAI